MAGRATAKEVSSEISELERIKKTVISFGENHRPEIEAQILVLSEGMQEQEIVEKWKNEPDTTRSALIALNWLIDVDKDRPSDDWDDLIN